jgi:hypothetical protein
LQYDLIRISDQRPAKLHIMRYLFLFQFVLATIWSFNVSGQSLHCPSAKKPIQTASIKTHSLLYQKTTDEIIITNGNEISTRVMLDTQTFVHTAKQVIIGDRVMLQSKSSGVTEYKPVLCNFFAPEYKVTLASEDGQSIVAPDRGQHFMATDGNDQGGIAAISLFPDNQAYGLFAMPGGKIISLVPDTTACNGLQKLILSEGQSAAWPTVKAACSTNDWDDHFGFTPDIGKRTDGNCKTVKIEIDIDYDLYVKFNKDLQAISNYATGLFNVVHMLYQRENIRISLAKLNIHTAEDYFRHSSSTADLEYFRKKYPNKENVVRLLLCGYTKNGQAVLGGKAYINTLCMKSYAYAYANVSGTYTPGMTYSWDVFSTSHELGHVIGSRHTHACAWGPQKNIAIDHCAPLEGSCASPGIPFSGTMMSYCYLSSMPGIDFLKGFGPEPGELLRTSIQQASCLESQSPLQSPYSEPDDAIMANVSCDEGEISHYYLDHYSAAPNDDVYVAGIRKFGKDIGSLSDESLGIQLITTKSLHLGKAIEIDKQEIFPGSILLAANRYWNIYGTMPPDQEVHVLIPVSAKDLEDLSGNGTAFSWERAVVYQVQAPGSADPREKFSGATAQNISTYTYGSTADHSHFNVTESGDGNYLLEFKTRKLTHIGFGMLVPSVEFIQFGEIHAEIHDGGVKLAFTTNKEQGCKHFVVEQALDELGFSTIQTIPAKGNGLPSFQYIAQLAKPSAETARYRVQAIHVGGASVYSPMVKIDIPKPQNTVLKLYPNPVTQSVLTFEYFHDTGTSARITVRILDASGKSLRSYSYYARPGQNTYNIYTSSLKNGSYYLQLSSATGIYQLPFTINR